MVMDISAVILAGGENSRFGGKPKSDIVIGHSTILSRITETIRDIFDELIIVSNRPVNITSAVNYKIVSDVFKGAGPMGGIHAGMKASSKKAVFIFACDMPFLDKKLIKKQISSFLKSDTDALVPLLDGSPEPLHAIYSVKLLPMVEKALEGKSYSIMKIFGSLNVKYLTIRSSDPEAASFTNINSPSDLDQIQRFI